MRSAPTKTCSHASAVARGSGSEREGEGGERFVTGVETTPGTDAGSNAIPVDEKKGARKPRSRRWTHET